MSTRFTLGPPPAFTCRGCGRPTTRWRPAGRGVPLTCPTCTPALPRCDRLRHARRQSGLPLGVAAERSGLSLHVLALAEIRPGPWLQREELEALAGVYGVRPAALGVKGGGA